MSQAVRAAVLGCVAVLAFAAVPRVAAIQEKKKPSKEAVRELGAAIQLLNAGKIEEAAGKLRGIIERHPGDPVAEKAKGLLLENGVGDEIRVVLDDRKVFRERFKFPEKEVLKLAEDALDAVEPKFKGVAPYFLKRSLEVHFYDSEARYRKATGFITAAGHFTVDSADHKTRTLEGKIQWHFPKYAATPKDRLLTMKATLTHETAHYLSAVHFGGRLPSPIEEGIATFLESRLNTEYYQYFRQTDRERIESNARNSTNAIAKYDDFVRMLEGSRGFGKGDIMIERWYGVCYALVDFMDQGEIDSKKASFQKLLKSLEALTAPEEKRRGEKQGEKEGSRPLPRLDPKKVLESLVHEFYGVKLEAFHAALLQHIIASYRQK